MKIAAFIPSLAGGTGGTERCAAALLRELAARGHRVVAFTSGAAGADLGGAEIRRVPRLPGPSPLAYASFLASAAVLRRLSRENFDLLYSAGANTLAADVATAHYSAARGLRLMRSGELALSGTALRRFSRTAFLRLAGRAERALYRSAGCRRIIAVSDRLRGDLLEDYDLPPGKLAVVPNGVDGVEFNPALRGSSGREVRTRLGLAEGGLLALFLGGDWERKGLATLLEAFARLSPARGNLKLAVVGQGSIPSWRRRADGLGLADRVVFAGSTARPAEWYAAADFLVLPTRYEPFGLPPLECGACGAPALFSSLCGCAEVLPDGEAGLHLRDPLDAAELAMKIETLAADEELRRRLAAGAMSAAARWDWARVAQATEAVFEQVLTEKRERR